MDDAKISRTGILFGIGAYLSWGFFPLYFKALQNVSPLQIMANRVVWSFILLVGIVAIQRAWPHLRGSMSDRRTLLVHALAGVLLAINWLVYIYGVNSGQVVETSLGYFINPLVSVALGVIFLRERLRPLQWVPVGMATTGVLYLTVQVGSLPWIALALAFSFGFYGLMKKVSSVGSLDGLTLETGAIFLPALSYLLWMNGQGQGAFGHTGWLTTLLLVLSGVLTTVPLLMFARAAQSIPLWTIGLLQYIAPTVQFLIGVLVFHEPFDQAHLIGFGIIWAALLIFTLEGLLYRQRRVRQARTQPQQVHTP
ncbi:MAG: EamA family transporter RarD [Anaerolineales bacterium]|jgi:chloramphenicol-sensitive protein RarD